MGIFKIKLKIKKDALLAIIAILFSILVTASILISSIFTHKINIHNDILTEKEIEATFLSSRIISYELTILYLNFAQHFDVHGLPFDESLNFSGKSLN